MYPPCSLSHVFNESGLYPANDIETDEIKQPALQMVSDEVPS